jgi:hypothetical protein
MGNTSVYHHETTAPHFQLNSLGVIDRASILRHLISQVEVKYKDRYAEVLSQTGVESMLEAGLSAGVGDICETGRFTLQR